MKNFIFKSNASDLQKMFSILENLQKNVVYSTYKMDAILKVVKRLETDLKLQTQVDTFFESEETSPQTEPETKDLD